MCENTLLVTGLQQLLCKVGTEEVQGLLLDQTGIWKRADVRRHSWADIIYYMWVYLYYCCSASSMHWMRHYLRWYSCRRRFHCCSPLNSGQSGGKHGRAYLAGWPKLPPPLRSAAGRRRRRSGGRPSPRLMRHHGTAGPGSSEGSEETQKGRWVDFTAASTAQVFLFTGKKWLKPAWWSDGEECCLLGWPGGGAGGRTLWTEPASAAETPAALLSTMKMRSYCGRLVRTPAGRYAALFPALAAVLWQTHLSAYWYAQLSKPFSDWMTCTVHRGLPRLLSCPASSGRWSQCCTGCRWRVL